MILVEGDQSDASDLSEASVSGENEEDSKDNLNPYNSARTVDFTVEKNQNESKPRRPNAKALLNRSRKIEQSLSKKDKIERLKQKMEKGEFLFTFLL